MRLGAYRVSTQTVVCAPMAEHTPVRGETISVQTAHVPRVLPFRRLVRHVEPFPYRRKVNSERERRIPQTVVAFVRAILSGVGEVHGKRRTTGKCEAAG